jgi:hypothetical protein
MTVVRRRVVSISALAAGGVGVTLLAPGTLGEVGGLSAVAYERAVAAADRGPGWVVVAGEHAAIAGLLLLAGLLAWAGWSGWRLGTPATAGAFLVGAGVVLSYLASEAAKLVVDEERPCRAFTGVRTWVSCPPTGDWSFPSNHATVAGALAAGVVLLAPRLAALAVPLALTVAATRVVTGVHYPHDVLAGLVLGAAVTTAVLVALTPATTRLGDRASLPASVPR